MENIRELSQFERADYPYSVTARRESITKNKEALKSMRQEAYGTTLKEAMSSDVLSGFIPDLFIDEIILLGQRQAIARNSFPVVSQANHGSFKQRYRYKDEGVTVTSKENVGVKQTQSERTVTEFSFLKLMDSNVLSLELVEDSTLDEASAEIQLSASKFYRRENQLMSHRLTEYSHSTNASLWNNYVQGPDSSSSDSDLIDAMTSAYLRITTRLHDQFPTESLTWFVSPTVYAQLFQTETFRRFDILGGQPNIVTGKIAGTDSIFRIPIQIWEPGYFDTNSVWIPQAYDICLVATQFAAGIRERWSMRTSPLDMTKILAQGVMMFERLIPWVRNPFAYIRVGPTGTYSNLIPNMSNINILAGTDSPTVFDE